MTAETIKQELGYDLTIESERARYAAHVREQHAKEQAADEKPTVASVLDFDVTTEAGQKAFALHMESLKPFIDKMLPKEQTVKEKARARFQGSEIPGQYLCEIDQSKMGEREGRMLQAWTDEIKAFIDGGHAITLRGPKGRGKSFFGVQILRACFAHAGGLFIDDRDLVYDLNRATTDIARDVMVDKCMEAGVLMIDDLGQGRYNGNGRVALDKILIDRINHRRPMILTTNLDDQQFIDMFGDPFVSRLRQAAGKRYYQRIDGIGQDIRMM
jgi:DNA replication protein DnaC